MGEVRRTKVAGRLALLAGILFLVAGVVSGKPAPWIPIGCLWLIIGAGALRRGQTSVPPTEAAVVKPFDKALAACLIAGAVLGIMLTTVADIQSSTPLPSPGDTVTPVTSTFSVFGVAIKESTGPWGADHSRRFSQFHSIVGLAFVLTGMLAGLAVYLVGFRPRGRANAEPGAAVDPSRATGR